MTNQHILCSALALALSASAVAADQHAAEVRFDAGTVSGLGARNIGSAAMSGRIAALDAITGKDGKTDVRRRGHWRVKSTDGALVQAGVRQTAGAVDRRGSRSIRPNEYGLGRQRRGAGRATRCRSAMGIKSTDAGETWTNMRASELRITQMIIDPRSADTVYACVPGKLWSDSADRGLYKTSDGGKHWELALKGGNLSTGCASVSLDPKDSNVLFASLWDFRRKGWTFRSGGESATAKSGSGLYRSADGGKSWTELTDGANKGFPQKPYGRIAVTIASSNPQIVYSFVESTDSALYRSDDGGKTWDKRDKSQFMVWRPFYFARCSIRPIRTACLSRTWGW